MSSTYVQVRSPLSVLTWDPDWAHPPARCDDHHHMSRPAVVTSGGTVHLRCDMERVIRLLRLARLRRDLLAIATLETRLRRMSSESELRALWGDR